LCPRPGERASDKLTACRGWFYAPPDHEPKCLKWPTWLRRDRTIAEMAKPLSDADIVKTRNGGSAMHLRRAAAVRCELLSVGCLRHRKIRWAGHCSDRRGPSVRAPHSLRPLELRPQPRISQQSIFLSWAHSKYLRRCCRCPDTGARHCSAQIVPEGHLPIITAGRIPRAKSGKSRAPQGHWRSAPGNPIAKTLLFPSDGTSSQCSAPARSRDG
jgi:hypothetical protein